MTSLPDVRKLILTENDAFIILACDGLWKSFSNEEAIRFALNKHKELKDPKEGASTNSKGINHKVWTRVADELSAEAVLRGCGDNVSIVLVVFVDNVAKLL